jgi:hypothetical protein
MIRRIFASLLLLLVLITTPLLSFLYATFETYLNPDFYQNEDVVNKIYDKSLSFISTNLAQNENLKIFTEEEINEQLKQILPIETLLELNKSIFDQITKEPLPNEIIVDLTEIKEALPLSITEIIENYTNKLEPCTEEEIANMVNQQGENGIPTCLPPDMTKEQVINSLNDIQSSDSYKNIPSQLNLNLNAIPAQPRMLMGFIIHNNTLIRGILIGLFLLQIILIGLIIFKPIKSVLRWVANAFFWTGLPLALMNLTIEGTVKAVLFQFAGQNPNINLTQADQTMQFVLTFIKLMTDKIVIHGIILTVIGIVLFIISFLIHTKNDELK